MSNSDCVIVVPSLVAGGLERVAAELANYFAASKSMRVHILTLSDADVFYPLATGVELIQPSGNYIKSWPRSVRLATHVRSHVKRIQPRFVLSFGSVFNSLVLFSTIGLNIPIFVSDRSNPYRNSTFKVAADRYVKHDGLINVVLKWILYRRAAGIVAQTALAKEIDSNFLNHKNIRVIGNPVRQIASSDARQRHKVILNVGRFYELKNQKLLVDTFHKIGDLSWKLMFAGLGPTMEQVKSQVRQLGLSRNVEFVGEVKDIDNLYQRASIFAFTSLSEGFPNALAEALNTPVACIAIDCVSGPAELIENGVNGFLIPVDEERKFANHLQILMEDHDLRMRFENKSTLTMKEFASEKICERYFKFLTETRR